MKGIPPEIDDLLWRLAEDGGPAARAEFETRHARYGPELSRRVRMVAELRQAGRALVHRPSFTPRPKKVAATPRWAVGAAIGTGTLALGAVVYVLASSGERPTMPPPPPVVRTSPAPPPSPAPVALGSEEPKRPSTPAPPVETEPATPTPKYLVPREVRVADTSLVAAIQLVAAGGGLQATIAPGFEDRKVTHDYRGLNTLDALRAMGQEDGFTVLEEQEGHVLIVPVRDETSVRRVGP